MFILLSWSHVINLTILEFIRAFGAASEQFTGVCKTGKAKLLFINQFCVLF